MRTATFASQAFQHVFDKDSRTRELRSLLHQLGQRAFRLTANDSDVREIDHQLAPFQRLVSIAADLPKFTKPRFHQLSFENQSALQSRVNGGNP